jgi:hypothetical protein
MRPYLEKSPSLKRAGGVAQYVGHEFKHHKKEKRLCYGWIRRQRLDTRTTRQETGQQRSQVSMILSSTRLPDHFL